MRKLMMLAVLAAVLAFSTFAFTRMESSDGVGYRARIAELESAAGELKANVAELEAELKRYEAEFGVSEEEEPCSSS